MGFTTRVKSEASEKKPFNFALFWDKYGTFFTPGDHRRQFLVRCRQNIFLTTNNNYPDFCAKLRDGTDRHGGILRYSGRRYRPFGRFRYGSGRCRRHADPVQWHERVALHPHRLGCWSGIGCVNGALVSFLAYSRSSPPDYDARRPWYGQGHHLR